MAPFKKCPHCSVELRDRDHEMRHEHTHIPSKWRPYKCTKCPSYFDRLCGLRRHESKLHKRPTGRTYAVCKHCGMRMREARLAKHLLTHAKMKSSSITGNDEGEDESENDVDDVDPDTEEREKSSAVVSDNEDFEMECSSSALFLEAPTPHPTNGEKSSEAVPKDELSSPNLPSHPCTKESESEPANQTRELLEVDNDQITTLSNDTELVPVINRRPDPGAEKGDVRLGFANLVAGCTDPNGNTRQEWRKFLEESPTVRHMLTDLMTFLHAAIILHKGELCNSRRSLMMLESILRNRHMELELGKKAEELCLLHISLATDRSICDCCVQDSGRNLRVKRVEFERHMRFRYLAAKLIGSMALKYSNGKNMLKLKCKIRYVRCLYAKESSTEAILASIHGLCRMEAFSAIMNAIRPIGKRIYENMTKSLYSDCRPYVEHMIRRDIGHLFPPQPDDNEETFEEKYGAIGGLLFLHATANG